MSQCCVATGNIVGKEERQTSFEYFASIKKKSFKVFSDDHTSFKQPQISPIIIIEKILLYNFLIDITDTKNTKSPYVSKHTVSSL